MCLLTMYNEKCQHFEDLPNSVNETFCGTNMRDYRIMMGKKNPFKVQDRPMNSHVTEYDIYRYGFKSHITTRL